MMTIRPRTILAPFAAGCLATLALLLATYALAAADDGGPTSPAGVGDDLAGWWRSGALASPIAIGVYALLSVCVVLSRTRWPGLAWLRRGRVQAWIALTIGGLTAILPVAIDGTLTVPGLLVALSAGALAVKPGGLEAKDETSDPPA